jgi:hypothetical protein
VEAVEFKTLEEDVAVLLLDKRDGVQLELEWREGVWLLANAPQPDCKKGDEAIACAHL